MTCSFPQWLPLFRGIFATFFRVNFLKHPKPRNTRIKGEKQHVVCTSCKEMGLISSFKFPQNFVWLFRHRARLSYCILEWDGTESVLLSRFVIYSNQSVHSVKTTRCILSSIRVFCSWSVHFKKDLLNIPKIPTYAVGVAVTILPEDGNIPTL